MNASKLKLGRSDSYWNQLSEQEQQQIRPELMDPKVSLADLARRAPVWSGGRNQGQPPSINALWRTRQTLWTWEAVTKAETAMEAASKAGADIQTVDKPELSAPASPPVEPAVATKPENKVESAPPVAADLKDGIPDAETEIILERLMPLIGIEVVDRTVTRLEPAARSAAVRLLLRRADQNLHWKKYELQLRKFRLKEKEQQAKEKPLKDPTEPITEEMWERLEKELGLM